MAPSASNHEETAFSKEAGHGILRDRKKRKFCDIELVCQGTRIPVHKVVVCTQSTVFSTAFSCSYFQEAGPSSYDIHDTDRQTVERMVEYLYTGEYSYSAMDGPQAEALNNISPSFERIRIPRGSFAKRDTSTLLPHLDVLALADKYLLKDLAAKAVEYFRAELLALKNTPKFFEVIPAVYALECESSTLLREECVQATRSCFGSTMAFGETKRKLLDDALALTPKFAKELLGACVVSSEPNPKKYKEP